MIIKGGTQEANIQRLLSLELGTARSRHGRAASGLGAKSAQDSPGVLSFSRWSSMAMHWRRQFVSADGQSPLRRAAMRPRACRNKRHELPYASTAFAASAPPVRMPDVTSRLKAAGPWRPHCAAPLYTPLALSLQFVSYKVLSSRGSACAFLDTGTARHILKDINEILRRLFHWP